MHTHGKSETVWLLTTNSSQKRVVLSHCFNDADWSLCAGEQWNSPIDCIVGFIEVSIGRVQPSKASVFKSVKTIPTRISDRSIYPDPRCIIRGIWRERKRGKGHNTAWQNTYSIKLHMSAAWLWSTMEHQMLPYRWCSHFVGTPAKSFAEKGWLRWGLSTRLQAAESREE